MPAGIPGDLTRPAQATVSTELLDTTYYPTKFGVPGAIDATSHNFRAIKASDTAASVYGFYVRPFPTAGNGTDGLGTSTPPVSGIANVLKRGYINVVCNYGTPVKNGAVYVRTVANGANTIIGGVEAQSDSTNSFVLTGATFTGPMDANGNAEIAYNL
jgi:hypothetical protein